MKNNTLIFKIDVHVEVMTYADYLKYLLSEREDFDPLKLELKLMLDRLKQINPLNLKMDGKLL